MTFETFLTIPVFDKSEPMRVKLAGNSHCDGTYKIVNKKSNIATFEYIISGSGTIINQKGQVLHPQKGDTFFLPENEYHEYFSSDDDPWVKIWIGVSGPLVDFLMNAYGLREQNIFHCDTEVYFREMHKILISKDETPNEIASRVSVVFHEMVQFLAENKDRTKTAPTDAVKLKNYIDTHIHQQITIDELATIISKSNAHTIRIFKNAYGVTPYKYCIDNRIKKAKELLRNTNSPVKEIAFALSFCDEHYFTNIFKEKTGITPSQYKKSKLN